MTVVLNHTVRLCICIGSALLVAWGLWRCQVPGEPLDLPLTYGGHADSTKEGWPAFHSIRHEWVDWDPSVPPKRVREILWAGLFVDLAVWSVILAGTVVVAWRLMASRGQMRLATVLFAVAVVAILLSWWRCEYECCRLPEKPERSECLRSVAQTPMLRLTRQPLYVSGVVGIGLACAIQSFGHLTISLICRVLVYSVWIGNSLWRRARSVIRCPTPPAR